MKDCCKKLLVKIDKRIKDGTIFSFACGKLEDMKKEIKDEKGDVAIKIEPTFKGGCGKEVTVGDAYRCIDCTASFHRECLYNHFKFPMEKEGEHWTPKKKYMYDIQELLAELPAGARIYKSKHRKYPGWFVSVGVSETKGKLYHGIKYQKIEDALVAFLNWFDSSK